MKIYLAFKLKSKITIKIYVFPIWHIKLRHINLVFNLIVYDAIRLF